MTLAEMRAANPELFHPNQDWFEEEDFMHAEPDDTLGLPRYVIPCRGARSGWPEPASAATLARLYILTPLDPMWTRYLWTCDVDSLGQRVYMGCNERGMEIHRHLHLTERWGVPYWGNAA